MGACGRWTGGALGVLGAAAMGLGAGPATAAPGGPPVSKDVKVVADHLDRPRGLAFDAAGRLYATEVGHGPGGRPSRANCNDEGCFGATGRIVRIAGGRATPLVTGLLSMRGNPDGIFTIGADSLATLPDGRLVTAMTSEFTGRTPTPPRQVPAPLRPQIGRIIIAPAAGGPFTLGPSISALEFADDPDGAGKVSNPYGVATVGDTVYVSDSAANTLVEVKDGIARTIAVFPKIGEDDSVPDALTAGPDGTLWVGEFTGTGNRPVARVWRIRPGQAPEVFASGLRSITGIAVSRSGNVYVSQFVNGEVVRISPDGDRFVAARNLEFPAGLAISPKTGLVYVAERSVLPSRLRAGDLPPKELRGRYGRIVRLK